MDHTNGHILVSEDEKWDYALGMIKIDGLEPSPEMKKLIEQEKNGEITTDDVLKALDRKYKMKQVINERSIYVSGISRIKKSGKYTR